MAVNIICNMNFIYVQCWKFRNLCEDNNKNRIKIEDQNVCMQWEEDTCIRQ